MSIDSINKNILSLRIIENINSNLGIDNNSLSSKTRLMSDALASEIDTIAALTTEAISRISTSTANGVYLDMNGAEFGVYRNYSPYLIVDKDNAAYISPINATTGFDDIMVGKQIINAGEYLEVDGSYIVTFLKPVIIESKFLDVETSIRIEPIDTASSIRISANTVFEMAGNNNPYLEYVLLKISADINTPFEAINDEDFRIVIQKKKALENVSSEEAIATSISLIKGINGYTVSSAENGAGNIVIRIVTNDMVYLGSDNRFSNISAFIKGSLNNIVPAGINIDVEIPEQYNLKIIFNKNNSAVPTAIISEAITEFIKLNYQYAETQVFNTESMTKSLLSQYKSLKDVVITSVSIFDNAINETIVDYTDSIELDRLSYITISSDDVSEEVVGE